MASSEKRCLYEVLGLSRDCSPDEIRSAYRKLALQRHPDKLVQAGVSEAEATAAFQELVNAYEVLSDARERAWYDSHRNEILFSSSTGKGSSSSSDFVPDLFSFFSNAVYSGYSDSGRGFYKVYGDLFEKIYSNELNFAKKLGLPLPKEAPLMGNLESPYIQVTAFYNYWLGFVTSMDFFWADQYDVMAGPNRKSRRLMEDENKKLRKKARREYNETVRGLAEFVKKRDKRVIDMQMKRNEEMEKKREEERQRKKELERQKAERVRNYEEAEWTKVDEMEDDIEDNEADDFVEEKQNELYCVVCSKKFKSDKQWKNHEQSKKHKEKVAELRGAFKEEDKEYEATKRNRRKGREEKEVDENNCGYLSAVEEIDELQDQFEGNLSFNGEEIEDENAVRREADGVADIDNGSEGKEVGTNLGSDDESSILEAMVSGRKSRKKVGNQMKHPPKNNQVDTDSDELEFMEYNDTKISRRNRGRKERGRRHDKAPETVKTDEAVSNDQAEEHDGPGYGTQAEESPSHPLPESVSKSIEEDATDRSHKHPAKNNRVDTDSDELEFMEYNDTKISRRNRGRKERGRRHDKAPDNVKTYEAVSNDQAEEHDVPGNDTHPEESPSLPLPESVSKSIEEDAADRSHKHPRAAINKNLPKKKDNITKSKATSSGRRQKVAEGSDHVCEKCGQEFESRNKLHKHLGDTGHASLKHR